MTIPGLAYNTPEMLLEYRGQYQVRVTQPKVSLRDINMTSCRIQ